MLSLCASGEQSRNLVDFVSDTVMEMLTVSGVSPQTNPEGNHRKEGGHGRHDEDCILLSDRGILLCWSIRQEHSL